MKAVKRAPAFATGTAGAVPARPRLVRRDRLHGFLLRYGRDRAAVCGAAAIATVLLAGLMAPLLGLPAPNAAVDTMRMAPPGTPGFVLGADEEGRNILSRLGHGITLLNEQQAPVAGFPHSPFLRPQARMASRKPLVPAEDGPRGRRKAAATCPAVHVEMLEALLRPVS